MLVRVALPVPLYREFDYLPLATTTSNDHLQDSLNVTPTDNGQTSNNTVPTAAPNLPAIGSRVQVPFGRQTLVGIVVTHIDTQDTDAPLNKLKPIKAIIDHQPILNGTMLALAKWLANYYHYPLGDVLSVMLPTLVRQGKPLDLLITHWRILPTANVDDSVIANNAPKQQQQFAMLKLHGKHGASEETLLLEGMERPFLKKLEAKGVIERYLEPPPAPKPVSLAKLSLDLNAEQRLAVDAVIQTYHDDSYQGYLLNGVTGSGKTEVYLQAMWPVLQAGQQVLVLVPEIGLTPQILSRFSERFAAHILLLHSGVNNTQRLHGWEDCRQGRAQIIIGTRSAILYPYANLGLIIVDEAHDTSYKQQDTLRYHAADVALYRGYHANIPVLLGTATPALEHLKLVNDGKLQQLSLTTRAGHAKPAKMQLVDARDIATAYSDMPVSNPVVHNPANPSASAGHPQNNAQSYSQNNAQNHKPDLLPSLKAAQNTGLTPAIITAIRDTLDAGDQVLVFLNRRGYAPILLCSACGWQANCVRCDAHMTLHHSQLNTKMPSYLKCHHCDWQTSIPLACPDCGSTNLDAVGLGTTRLTESLHALFANPQTSKTIYPIIQIDRDTTRRQDSWADIYRRINSGNPAILVGTQMVAKGHHFPDVTLVCLPNADRGFLSPDFRSPERTAQLIVQVAGRSGRGSKEGRVMIQTVQPENPLLCKLVYGGYQAFAADLLEERKMLGLPPYTHAALIRCEGKTLARTMRALTDAVALLPPNDFVILGPIEAPMTKKNSRYHVQLLLSSKRRPLLHQVLSQWWPQVLALPSAKYLKLTLDIDPIGF